MEKIIVFGATGGTGKLVVEQALQAGHQVTVVVRDPDKLAIRHQQLKIIKGDVFQQNSFGDAIKGQDAVVSCLGVRKIGPTTVYSEGIRNIMEAMQEANIKRLICLSAGAVIVPPKSSLLIKFVTKNILQKIFRSPYADMLIMEKILLESNLSWTVIRAPWLRDTKHTGKYRTAINEHLRNLSKISRADLADYIVNHLTDEKTFKAKLEISY
ncbi:NAD(P)-dependent oxidoreductase [Flavitalea flava]